LDLQYLQHHQIDKEKWDKAIENSHNSLLYALSWYLDIISPNWDAIVSDDYSVVMPLTWRKKYGIKYLYKPFFSQFLGVFYQDESSSVYVKDFIEEAFKHFRFVNININVANFNFKEDYCTVKETQVLDLSGSYSELKKRYNRSTKNNVTKANKEELVIKRATSNHEIIELIQQMYSERQVKGVTENDYEGLAEIMNYSLRNQLGEIFHVYKEDKLCAAAFFLKWEDRIISLQTANNDKGRNTRALFKLMDYYIQENAGSSMILDFAGSNIPGVANWNLGFGAITQNYYLIKKNNLPLFIRWIKK
jgi:hypothetical protein